MTCPYCSFAVKLEIRNAGVIKKDEFNASGQEILYASCPNCNEVIIYLNRGVLGKNTLGFLEVKESLENKMIYPVKFSFENSKDIPKTYLQDYEEALTILGASPKSSAALTRRLLQNILREEFKIIANSLSQEIQKFVLLTGIPSHLTDAVDAIRIIGNLAAHPTKDKSTGEIVDVEVGEAEWLIEVIEALFDFVFIQPIKLTRRKKDLNEKLQQAGKVLMK